MTDGFVDPDFSAELDVSAFLAAVPSHVTVKGMLVEAIARSLPTQDGRRYVAFKDYPLREFMELMVACARARHSRFPIREGLRMVGQAAYPAFAQSQIGRVLFGVLGNDVAAIMRVASRAYKISLSVGTAEAVEVTDAHAHVVLKDVYAFPDCYQVGVFEGAILAAGRAPRVRVRNVRPASIELWCEWR